MDIELLISELSAYLKASFSVVLNYLFVAALVVAQQNYFPIIDTILLITKLLDLKNNVILV